MKRGLQYWYDHTSCLGIERMIRQRLPVPFSWFVKIDLHGKYIYRELNVIRVRFSFYINKPKLKDRIFQCDFTLDDFEKEANGSPCITKNKYKKKGK